MDDREAIRILENYRTTHRRLWDVAEPEAYVHFRSDLEQEHAEREERDIRRMMVQMEQEVVEACVVAGLDPSDIRANLNPAWVDTNIERALEFYRRRVRADDQQQQERAQRDREKAERDQTKRVERAERQAATRERRAQRSEQIRAWRPIMFAAWLIDGLAKLVSALRPHTTGQWIWKLISAVGVLVGILAGLTTLGIWPF